MADRPPRSATATRTRILDAARAQFAADGYDRTTMRSVAATAGVDAAMVVRYFRTKEALFAEAATFELDIPDLTHVPPERIAEVLMPRFFQVWEEDGTFLALMRAAATNAAAATTMQQVFATQVAPALAAVSPDRYAERAALVGTQVLGLVFGRYILAVPPLAEMTHEQLVRWVGPTLRRYLTEPLG
ncbi:TetR family transcriptional regulator [Rhodococcus sp. 06-462-5]|uniref:TetR/AcrR family transcriptional regulator n=1 Tax=unclassified Rhodococcus (in: high G+C Gram-positive bacteria) TaxID=192944 RepID=UPI000B9C5A36|nr:MULTISPECIES: TetR family transcriptional regulator [unclassified Rhodococcus (in: high G+C Gram-positive bacteria)]OZC68389.1 TetR family transcriptional regulator [Rhodococcus sp. 06-462-5]OZE66131.1 TetR family transcriptional regulator [Rhodococcus sp. 02-925g]